MKKILYITIFISTASFVFASEITGTIGASFVANTNTATTTNQNNISSLIISKQNQINILNQKLISISEELSDLENQISVKSKLIYDIYKNSSNLPTNYDSTVDSYLTQMNNTQNEIDSLQTKISEAKSSVDWFFNQYYNVKGGKTNANYQNYISWKNIYNSLSNSLLQAKNKYANLKVKYLYYKQLQTSAQNKEATNRVSQFQTELDQIKKQKNNKLLEQGKITSEKERLIAELNLLLKK